MTTLIIILSVSLFCLLLMIAYRSYELSYNKEFFSREKISNVDNKILTFYEKNIILLNRLYGKLGDLPEIISHKSHDLWELVSEKIDSRFEKIKRNKTENSRGSVSIYWKSVSQIKDSPRKELE